jgi:RNA polymerase sigma-70 factor (ECF subfamily)
MPLGEDASLLSAIARDRDRRAFEGLYDRHHRLVYGLACRMLGDVGEAEDVVQRVFLRAWERADTFDPSRGGAPAWLCVMTRSRCLDRLRQRGRRREQPMEQALLESLAHAAPGDADPALGQALARALERLPSAQRAAVEAVYFKGLTQAEAAGALKLPLGTLKGRLRLAMDKLAQALGRGQSAS